MAKRGVRRFNPVGRAVQPLPIPLRDQEQLEDDFKIALHAHAGVLPAGGMPISANPIGQALAGQGITQASRRIRGGAINPLNNTKFR